jgi:transposase
VYWKPVFNILEGVLEVVLVNARHVKTVPGRKTDVRDCEWLADLLRHGLLRASFIPPLPTRELRELTRHRHTLVRDQTAVSNRIIKLVESGNIKLAQVASSALGVSGRAMLQALARGEAGHDQDGRVGARSTPREARTIAARAERQPDKIAAVRLEGTAGPA